MALALSPEYSWLCGRPRGQVTPDELWHSLDHSRFLETKELVNLATGVRIWGNNQDEDELASDAIRETIRLLMTFASEVTRRMESAAISRQDDDVDDDRLIDEVVASSLPALNASAPFCA